MHPSMCGKFLSLYAFGIRWGKQILNPLSISAFGTCWLHFCEVPLFFQTPKPQILIYRSVCPTPFHLSEFRNCCVLLFSIWNPESWNLEVLVPHTFEIRELLCAIVWHLKPRNPESRNPKVLVPHPFTFQNLGMVVCCCLAFENHEIQNPEILKC